MSLAHNTSNSASLEQDRREFFSDVRELGRESALGKDSLPRLALRIVRAVTNGIVGPDDMKAAYDEYVTSESKKLVHTEGGKAANVSKLRQLATAAAMPTVDFEDVLTRACDQHKQMREEKLKPKSAYAAYVDVARAQIAAPTADLTDEEIRGVMATEPKEKIAKDFLRTAAKAIEKALALPDMQSDERELAEVALARTSEALAKIIAREELAEKQAQLASLQKELGLAA